MPSMITLGIIFRHRLVQAKFQLNHLPCPSVCPIYDCIRFHPQCNQGEDRYPTYYYKDEKCLFFCQFI